jgi:hypothetical protein
MIDAACANARSLVALCDLLRGEQPHPREDIQDGAFILPETI